MKELEAIFDGLQHHSTILLKDSPAGLECQFVMEGLVGQALTIQDPVLAAELVKISEQGIITGKEYDILRCCFDSFRLKVKVRQLYWELRSQPVNRKLSYHQLLAA